MSRNNHFTFNKYPEYRNRNNDYKNLKKTLYIIFANFYKKFNMFY